jgi:hypothetical protein
MPAPASSSTALGSSEGCSMVLTSPGSSRRQPRAEIVVIALRYETSLRRPRRRAWTKSAWMLTPHCSLSLPSIGQALCVPITSFTSCDQPIFVDHSTDLSLSSDAVVVEIDWLR